jgi:hypothetical protein
VAVTDAELGAEQLAALLDAERENTTLRAEVAHLRGERAAVVAWLREQALQSHPDAAGWFALNHVSVMIERDEHRREEKP